MIRIANIRTYKRKENEIPIKIDRSSILGNPFYMKNETERNLVCDKYQEYFEDRVRNRFHYSNREFMNELRRIHALSISHDIALLCWCAPKRCHGETIKDFIENYSQEN